jgi:hypothetical protein
MMSWHKPNPLLPVLIKHAGGPPLIRVAGVSGGLWLAGLLFFAGVWFFDPLYRWVYASWIGLVALSLTYLLPVAISILCYQHTKRTVRDEAFGLIKISALSHSQLIWALFLSSLYRMRILIAVMVGLGPLILAWFYFRLHYLIEGSACTLLIPSLDFDMIRALEARAACVEAGDPRLIPIVVINWLPVLGIWLWTLSGAAFGMGLSFKRRWRATRAAIGVAVALIGLIYTSLFTILYYNSACTNSCIYFLQWPPPLGGPLATVLIPALLFPLYMKLFGRVLDPSELPTR